MTAFSIIFIIMVVMTGASFVALLIGLFNEDSDVVDGSTCVLSFFGLIFLVMWFIGTHKGVETTVSPEKMEVIELSYRSYGNFSKQGSIKEKADFIIKVKGSISELEFPVDYVTYTNIKEGDMVTVKVTSKYRPLFDSTKVLYELSMGE